MINRSLIQRYVVGLFLLAMTLSAAPTTGIDRLAVVDFEISGDVGIPDAGRSVAALLLPKFGSRYQLVERMQLAKILAEHDLAIADIAKNPALLRGKTIEGVQFLVLGTVAKLGSLSVSARVVNVATGDIVQTAELSVANARELQNSLADVAKILQMNAEEKKKYVEARAQTAANGRPGELLIEGDESHLFDFAGDPEFFWNRDMRFRGAGRQFSYTVQIWPAENLKQLLNTWKKDKEDMRKTQIASARR